MSRYLLLLRNRLVDADGWRRPVATVGVAAVLAAVSRL